MAATTTTTTSSSTSTSTPTESAYGQALLALYELSKKPGGLRGAAHDPKSGAILGAQYGNRIGGAYGAAVGALIGFAAGGVLQAVNYFANKRPQFSAQQKQQALDYLTEYLRAAPRLQGRELTIEQLFQIFAALRIAYGSKGMRRNNNVPNACHNWPPNTRDCEVTTTFNADAKALKILRGAFDGTGLSLMKQAALLIDKARSTPIGAPISVQYENAPPFPNPGPDPYLLARPLGEAFVLSWAKSLGKSAATLYADPFWTPVELRELYRHVLDYVADTKGIPLSPTAMRLYAPTPEQLAAQVPQSPQPPPPATPKPTATPTTTAVVRYTPPAKQPATLSAIDAEIAKLEASIAADKKAGRALRASDVALLGQYKTRRARAAKPLPTAPKTVAALDAEIARLQSLISSDRNAGLPELVAERTALDALLAARKAVPANAPAATAVDVQLPAPSGSSSASWVPYVGALALLLMR